MRKALAIIGTVVAGVASPGNVSAQNWEDDFPPAPACAMGVALAAPPRSGARSEVGTLIVRPVSFQDGDPIPYTRATITTIGLGEQLQARLGFDRMDSTAVREFRDVPAGTYILRVGSIGYFSDPDTVTVRPGAADTVTVALEAFFDWYRNVHNCRPRGFRRAGESACVTDPRLVERELNYARTLASPEDRTFPEIPYLRPSQIKLVTDEGLCERAGREYGGPDDPPRRVVVIRLGRLFMVYDPFEPEAAGEWDVRSIYDRNWKPVLHIAG